VQRRIDEAAPAAASDLESVTPPVASDRQTNAIAIIMLVLPIVAGVLIWQRETLQMTTRAVRLLGWATILATAVLGYCDMRRLLLRSRGASGTGSQPTSLPLVAFLGMLGLWLLAYPFHFLARRQLGATNLILPGLVATALFLAPIVTAWFSEPALPSVASADVVALVVRIIEDSPMYQDRKHEIGKLEVREPIEISFDQQRQRRVARAQLVSKLGEQDIFYTVQWQDRKNGMFSVQVLDRQP
jgi:hypothetical protein